MSAQQTEARTSGRVRAVRTTFSRLVRTHPFTTIIVSTFVVAQIIAVAIKGPISLVVAVVGTGVRPVVVEARWWTPFTSLFFTNSVVQFIVVLLLAVGLVGVSESMMGWRRTLIAYFVTGVLGISLGILIQVAGERGGELWASDVFRIVTVTPFAAVCGTIATASAFAGPLWRRRIRVLTLLITLVFVLYSGQPADLYRFLSVILGIAFGLTTGPKMSERASGWPRSSSREIRVLMASVVGITAVGPAIALLSHSRFGPLAPIGLLFTNRVPDARGVLVHCQVFNLSAGCAQSFTLERIDGIGPILLSVLPLLVLLVAAYGLVYGSRFALWLAISVNVLLALLAALYFGLLPAAGATGQTPHAVSHFREIQVGLVISAALPVVVALVLFLLRAHFPVLTPARAVRRFVLTIVISAVVLAGIYVVVGLLLGGSAFNRSVDVRDLLADVVQRFIPVNFLSSVGASFLPTTYLGGVLYHGVGPLFWLIVIVASLRPMLGNAVRASGSDASRARELVLRGGDALGFMTTWPGNVYWFDPDGDAAVAYRVVNGIAITTGGPFGKPVSEEETIRRFARFCDDHGWVPVFYSVDGGLSPVFITMSWEAMVVAEEAVIHPAEWSTTGKKMQDIRTSINRAERAGIRAEWTTHAELSLPMLAQLAEISEEWIADKDLPEMGFTLGGLSELRDPAVRLMLAIDADGRVEGITSWLPMFRDGVVIGWTLDFMRRRAGSINGVMEFLIAESAVQMKNDGIEIMSLSGAPLAHASGKDPDAGGLDTVLDYLSASLEPVYGFQSLLRFKRKFRPEFQPLIMAYPDAVALPRIGIALTRAYLPGLSVTQAAGLVRSHG